MTKFLSSVVALSLIATISWVAFEPQLMEAVTDSVTITQIVTTGLAISDCVDFSLSQTLSGLGNGTISTGECTWTVKTANGAGFNMTLYASQDSALVCVGGGCTVGTDAFADYSPAATGTPDYTWAVTSTTEFGYTVEPETPGDTVQLFLDNNSSACNESSGTNNTDTCWYSFATGGAPLTIINRSSETDNDGENEVVKFWAEVGESAVQAAGTYEAIITATATDN